MKWPVLLLLLAPLLGFVTADAGKLFSKLSKTYKAASGTDSMNVDMAEEQSGGKAMQDAVGGGVMEPAQNQLPPMEHRLNPFFDSHYTKLTSYGPGWYPTYGGMAFDENRMRIDGHHPNQNAIL